MADTALMSLLQHAEEFVHDQFGAEGHFTPMWFAETKSGDRLGILTPFESGTSKDVISQVIKQMFRDKQVVRFIFATEAWSLDPMPTRMEDIPTGSIANHPDKVEVLMLNGEDVNGETITALFKIKRDKEKPYLDDYKVHRMTGGEGRFTGMLDQQLGRAQ